MAVGEDFVGTFQGMADAGPRIVLQDGGGYGFVPVDIFVFIAVPGIGVGVTGIKARKRFEINREKFLFGIVAQPGAHVVGVGLIGGGGDIMLVSGRNRPEILAGDAYILQRPVADLSAQLLT